MSKTNKTADRFTKLAERMKGKKALLIVMQDNPDPDAIGAAVALRELANKVAGAQCSIVHGGTIGRAENRALVQYLDLSLRAFDRVDLDRFDLIALVDTQPGAGNNSLPEGVVPDIVVDHHPIQPATRAAPLTDVRGNYGATSTIFWEYLQQAGIRPETPLATALLYGIRSDTQDLGREATAADIKAIEQLYPLANKRMLSYIQRGRVPASYYRMLADALRAAMSYGPCIVTRLGEVDNPDMMGEVADLLLRHEDSDWTLCYGFYQGKALLSLRCTDTAQRADEVVRGVVAGMGTGGGHANAAGGQVPLKEDTATERRRVGRKLRHRLLRALRIKATRGWRLIRSGGAARPKAR
jgi:nanoRNase/pAp phosphatase (c-di-AMP/oligoRNAs hydrolase)